MNRTQQIIQAHAGVIVQVVQTVQNPAIMPQMEEVLSVSEKNGWGEVVVAIRKILAGSREPSLMQGLDEEDSTIVEAILMGIQNPQTLPDPNQKPDASLAAPGIAHMVFEASKGNVQALEIVSNMAEQMSHAGGDMKNLSAIIKKLIDGERERKVLIKGMGTQGKQLVDKILEELHTLRPQ
ncbi:MAG: hypothetical protein ISR69_01535 [Gammaproteobacteria bacterium]|nr:hypothetical protein [Gammaproteobacteria bacterium]